MAEFVTLVKSTFRKRLRHGEDVNITSILSREKRRNSSRTVAAKAPPVHAMRVR